MHIPYVSRAAIVVAMTAGALAVAPRFARAQDASVLPDEPGPVTLVGCFSRETVEGRDKYVLVNPSVGQGTTVPDAACSATPGAPMIHLDDVHSHHLDQVPLGRWIEVRGKLGRVKHGDELREVQVKAFKEIPVAPPAAAALQAPESVTIPEPAEPKAPEIAAELPAQPTAAPASSAPVGTSGVKAELPKTASPLPSIALVGIVAIATGLVVGRYRRRRPFEEE